MAREGIALAIGYISSSTRVTGFVVLREKEKAYADAARAVGAFARCIMLRHILPNSITPYPVLVSVDIGSAITAAVLGFNLFGVAIRNTLDPRLRGR